MAPHPCSRTLQAGLALAVVLAAVALGAQPVSAHVSVGGDAPKGGFGQFAFSVPNERDDAGTTKVEVKMPTDHPLAFASAQAKPGWTVKITTRQLETPLESDEGDPVTDAVDTITWSGGRIGPGEFDTFAVSGGPFPEDADSLEFRAIQTYDDGEEVAWIEPMEAGGQEPEHPAPLLTLSSAGGEASETTTTPSTTAPSETPATTPTGSTSADDDGPSAVAVAGLVIAVIALAVAAAAMLSGRRRATT